MAALESWGLTTEITEKSKKVKVNLTGSRVKQARLQSREAPRLLSWW